jgi:hypothetical protein
VKILSFAKSRPRQGQVGELDELGAGGMVGIGPAGRVAASGAPGLAVRSHAKLGGKTQAQDVPRLVLRAWRSGATPSPEVRHRPRMFHVEQRRPQGQRPGNATGAGESDSGDRGPAPRANCAKAPRFKVDVGRRCGYLVDGSAARATPSSEVRHSSRTFHVEQRRPRGAPTWERNGSGTG